MKADRACSHEVGLEPWRPEIQVTQKDGSKQIVRETAFLAIQACSAGQWKAEPELRITKGSKRNF